MARNMIVENLPAVFFKNGTYLDLERGQIIKANILIQNGIIRAVCPDEIEDFAGRSIEINEQLIVPGLIDMHVHFGNPGNRCCRRNGRGFYHRLYHAQHQASN